MSQQYPVSEKKQAQPTINIEQEITKIVEKLQKIKVAYFSSELEQLRADSLEISRSLSLLRLALEDWPDGSAKKTYMASLETISSFIRNTLAEVRRFSEIRLSTLNQETTSTSVGRKLKQNIINTNKISQELEKFCDEGLIATPLEKSLFPMRSDLREILQDLRKAQAEFENDFLSLPFTKPEVDKAKQSARKIGILSKAEIEASSKAASVIQPTVKLQEILKETEALASHVSVLGGNFNPYADNTLINQSLQSQMLQEDWIQIEKLRSSVLEITEPFEIDDVKPVTSQPNFIWPITNLLTEMGAWTGLINPSSTESTNQNSGKIKNSEISTLRKQILDLLAVTERHLDLLNQISKLIQKFKSLQTFFELDNHLRYDWWKVLIKNGERYSILRETQTIKQNLTSIPEDQRLITLKLLDTFQDIQNKFKVTIDQQEARINEETRLLDLALTIPNLVEGIENNKFHLIIEKVERRLRLKIPDAPGKVRTLFRNLPEAFNSARSKGAGEGDVGDFVVLAPESKKQKKERIGGMAKAQSEIMYSVIAVLHDELSNSPNFFHDSGQEKDFYNRIVTLLDLLQELSLDTYDIAAFKKHRKIFYQKRVFTDERRAVAIVENKKDKENLKDCLAEFILPKEERWRLEPKPQEDGLIACTSMKLPLSKMPLYAHYTSTNEDEKNRDASQDFKDESKETDLESSGHTETAEDEFPRETGYFYLQLPESNGDEENSNTLQDFKGNYSRHPEELATRDLLNEALPMSATSRRSLTSFGMTGRVVTSNIPPSFSAIFGRSSVDATLEIKSLQPQNPIAALPTPPRSNSVPRSFSYFFGPSGSVSDISPPPEIKDLPPRIPSIPPVYVPPDAPQLGKPLAIGFGIFLVALMTGAAVPTVVGFMVGKEKTLEFLFSTNEGMCTLGAYTGLEGLLGVSLIAVSVYWFCKTYETSNSQQIQDQSDLLASRSLVA